MEVSSPPETGGSACTHIRGSRHENGLGFFNMSSIQRSARLYQRGFRVYVSCGGFQSPCFPGSQLAGRLEASHFTGSSNRQEVKCACRQRLHLPLSSEKTMMSLSTSLTDGRFDDSFFSVDQITFRCVLVGNHRGIRPFHPDADPIVSC